MLIGIEYHPFVVVYVMSSEVFRLVPEDGGDPLVFASLEEVKLFLKEVKEIQEM